MNAQSDRKVAMVGSDRMGFGRLMASMALFVVIGTPLVFYLWTVLNDVLAGSVRLGQLGLALPALLLFALILALLARSVSRWEARPVE